MMKPSLDKPKNLKRKNPFRLILLMGLAGLCLLLAANQIGAFTLFPAMP